jgi:hypothetical protein
VSEEILYIDTYSCPRCRADLETRINEWQGWQRCPTCGMLSLPPEPPRWRDPQLPVGRPKGSGDVLVISDSPDRFADPDQVAPTLIRPTHISPTRLVFRNGLFVSLGLMLIFFLDQNTTNTAIFGFLAVVFFILLLRLSPSRSPGP